MIMVNPMRLFWRAASLPDVTGAATEPVGFSERDRALFGGVDECHTSGELSFLFTSATATLKRLASDVVDAEPNNRTDG